MKISYYLILAVFMTFSFTTPKTEWLVNFESLGVSESIDIYKGLFLLCLILYVPMMLLVFCCFARALVIFIRSKSFQDSFSLLIAPVTGLVALHRFNKWVFSEIF